MLYKVFDVQTDRQKYALYLILSLILRWFGSRFKVAIENTCHGWWGRMSGTRVRTSFFSLQWEATFKSLQVLRVEVRLITTKLTAYYISNISIVKIECLILFVQDDQSPENKSKADQSPESKSDGAGIESRSNHPPSQNMFLLPTVLLG